MRSSDVGIHDDDTPPWLARNKVFSAASTGIAALLLIGGGTVHRQFNVPIDIEQNTAPRMNVESNRAKEIRNADLIIIDVCIFYHNAKTKLICYVCWFI